MTSNRKYWTIIPTCSFLGICTCVHINAATQPASPTAVGSKYVPADNQYRIDDYGAHGTGIDDDSAAYEAMSAAAVKTCGTMLLGQRQYLISSVDPTVPNCTTLTSSGGFRTSVEVPLDPRSVKPALALAPSRTLKVAGVVQGIALVQSDLRPPSNLHELLSYTSKWAGRGITVTADNVLLSQLQIFGFAQGVYSDGHALLNIDHLVLDCVAGIYIANVGDVPRLDGINLNAYLTNAQPYSGLKLDVESVSIAEPNRIAIKVSKEMSGPAAPHSGDTMNFDLPGVLNGSGPFVIADVLDKFRVEIELPLRGSYLGGGHVYANDGRRKGDGLSVINDGGLDVSRFLAVEHDVCAHMGSNSFAVTITEMDCDNSAENDPNTVGLKIDGNAGLIKWIGGSSNSVGTNILVNTTQTYGASSIIGVDLATPYGNPIQVMEGAINFVGGSFSDAGREIVIGHGSDGHIGAAAGLVTLEGMNTRGATIRYAAPEDVARVYATNANLNINSRYSESNAIHLNSLGHLSVNSDTVLDQGACGRAVIVKASVPIKITLPKSIATGSGCIIPILNRGDAFISIDGQDGDNLDEKVARLSPSGRIAEVSFGNGYWSELWRSASGSAENDAKAPSSTGVQAPGPDHMADVGNSPKLYLLTSAREVELPTGWHRIRYRMVGGGGGSGCGVVLPKGTSGSGGGTGGTANTLTGEIFAAQLHDATKLIASIGEPGSNCKASGVTGSDPKPGGPTFFVLGGLKFGPAYGGGAGSNGQLNANSAGGATGSVSATGASAKDSFGGSPDVYGIAGASGGPAVCATGGSLTGCGGHSGQNGGTSFGGASEAALEYATAGEAGSGLATVPRDVAGQQTTGTHQGGDVVGLPGAVSCLSGSQNAGASIYGGLGLHGVGGSGGASCTGANGGNGGAAAGYGSSGGGGGSTLSGHLAGSAGPSSGGGILLEVD